MRPLAARVLTYGAIAALGAIAVAFTPPVPVRTPLPSVRGAVVVAPVVAPAGGGVPAAATAGPPAVALPIPPARLAPAALRVAPAVVYARRLPGKDTVVLSGTIRSSLSESLERVGQGEIPAAQRRTLAWRLADIFEHRVDMSRDLDEGDRFDILVERLQQPNGKIIINDILGAKLSVGDRVLEAVHYKSRGSSSEWFDAKGKSLTASFLRAPVEFRRITSVFGLRNHPIFGTWRSHTGTDYAAAMGTPVRAIGDGVVIAAGRRGGYGNAVDIRHANGYVSRYGHLRNIARSIRPGAKVVMGTTVGFVGMTGWATGPHLHFEIRVNGRPRDPRVALRNESGDPVPASEARLFREIRAHTLAALAAASGTERVATR